MCVYIYIRIRDKEETGKRKDEDGGQRLVVY